MYMLRTIPTQMCEAGLEFNNETQSRLDSQLFPPPHQIPPLASCLLRVLFSRRSWKRNFWFPWLSARHKETKEKEEEERDCFWIHDPTHTKSQSWQIGPLNKSQSSHCDWSARRTPMMSTPSSSCQLVLFGSRSKVIMTLRLGSGNKPSKYVSGLALLRGMRTHSL